MASPRQVTESPKHQGLDENRIYVFDWALVGTPTAATVTITDAYHVSKTATALSGAASIVGDTVVCPTCLGAGLQVGEYTLLCNATINGLPISAYLIIIAEY